MSSARTANLQTRPGRLLASLAILAAFLLTGCSVMWLAKYDEVTDSLTMQMQKSANMHAEDMLGAAEPDCFHASYAAYYRNQHADLGTLEMRAAALPKNQPTIDQVSALRSALTAFESLHKSASAARRCQSAQELQPQMRGINSIFGAILKLELAKKRGG